MSEPVPVKPAGEAHLTLDIGLVGIGAMGRGLAASLARSGHRVTVFDADPEAARRLDDAPVGVADHLEALFDLPFVITCLPTLEAISDVHGGARGWIANARPGSIAVDCSTSAPALTQELAQVAATRNVAVIDAPMLMGPSQAADGTLTLIVGGDPRVVARCAPIFEAISERVIHAGPVGSAHALKLINNSVVMGNHAVLCEAFTLAAKRGIDPRVLVSVLSSSRARSAKLDELAPRLIDDDHTLHFALGIAAKDLRLFNILADESEVPHAVGASVLDAFEQAIDMGFADQNVSRLATAMGITAGIDRRPVGAG